MRIPVVDLHGECEIDYVCRSSHEFMAIVEAAKKNDGFVRIFPLYGSEPSRHRHSLVFRFYWVERRSFLEGKPEYEARYLITEKVTNDLRSADNFERCGERLEITEAVEGDLIAAAGKLWKFGG